MKKVIVWLLSVTKSVLSPLIISTLCRIADQLLGISIYVISIYTLFRVYYEVYLGSFTIYSILKPALILVAISLAKAILRYGEQFFGHYVAFKSLELLRRELFSKLSPQAPAVMYNAKSGDLLAMATKDVDRIEVFFAHTFAPAVSAIVVPIIVLIAGSFIVPWQMVAVAAAFIFTSLILVPVFGQKRIIRNQSQYMQKRGNMASHVTDSIQGMNEIVGYGVEQRRIEELNVLQKDIFNTIKYTNSVFAGRRAVNHLIWLIQMPVLFLVGMYSFASPIAIIIFIVAVLRCNEVLRGVEAFSTDLNASLACANRLYTVCMTEPVVHDGKEEITPADSYSISVKDIYFTYPNSSKQTLKDINLEFKANTWSCLVGSTGCGKSTLMHLVQRYFDPQSGSIFINDQDITQVKVDKLREIVALVTQNTYLFNATIEENLRLADPDATQEQIWKALEIACLDEEVRNFENGLDTMVGEKGKSLSGGQVQRLCLARAILLNSKVLILDEFTAHLNTELEEKVRQNIKANLKDTTVIEITHRLDAISQADQVVVIDNGEVVENASPAQLLSDKNSALSAFVNR